MLQIAEGFGGHAAMLRDKDAGPAGTGHGDDKGGLPAGTGEASGPQADGDDDTFIAIGALAGAIVERLNRDRAARIAPRDRPAAPAGSHVATTAGRRPPITGGQMPTIGQTHIIATILAALASERRDRGEAILGFMEAEAGYLMERMPSTAIAMRIACQDARRLRATHMAAE